MNKWIFMSGLVALLMLAGCNGAEPEPVEEPPLAITGELSVEIEPEVEFLEGVGHGPMNEAVPDDDEPVSPGIAQEAVPELPNEPVVEPEPELPPLLFPSQEIMTTDGEKHIVNLSDIQGGGPPKDGIPSIDNPTFVSVEESSQYLDDDKLGVALSLNGIDRFYPFQIIVWHEIVNDNLGGTPALITYCPLCGTGIVFEPLVNGVVTEFGTSGKLWNSNLVMYDRQTDSYWSQALGQAIVGEQSGVRLDRLPYDVLTYANWKKDHPDGEVLSKRTGQFRNYSTDPYGDYYTSEGVWFRVDNTDDRYHDKAPSWGVIVDNVAKVYLQEELEKGPAQFPDTVGNVPVQVTFNPDNVTLYIERLDTKEEVIPFYGFWFSWVSVHPETEVYQP
jgi:hypothetical protein